MKAITGRPNRIENQLWPSAPKPRIRSRAVIREEDVDAPVVRRLDREPSFEQATCTGSPCPAGSTRGRPSLTRLLRATSNHAIRN